MPQSTPIKFENHLSLRVMEVFFPEGFRLESQDDLLHLKREWMGALRTWHSPYTCLFDARNFFISEEMRQPFEKLVQFFKGFFMRKIVGFYEQNAEKPWMPFELFEGYENATAQTGLGREGGLKRDLADLRSRIQIDNDFTAHVMEVSFLAETHLVGAQDISILKAKLTNILMQWHSPYSILINCVNLTFDDSAKTEFSKLERFLKGFFCKIVIGYAPKAEKSTYPFVTFRSRHLAAAELEHEGLKSGDVANCSTRK
jgi:hypothetical protein